MRRIFSYLLLSMIIVCGNGVMMAGERGDRSHQEYRGDNRRPGHGDSHNRPGGNKDKHHKDKHKDKHSHKGDKHNYRHDSYGRPGHSGHYYNGYHPGHGGWHPRLGNMVSHACRGGSDVDVWQISGDTYIVRFRRNGYYYTQRIYPASGRYGALNRISVNWSPSSPWISVPTFQLNINL